LPGIASVWLYLDYSISKMSANIDTYPQFAQTLADLDAEKLDTLYFAMGSDYYLYRQFIPKLQSAFRSRFGENADLVQRWGSDLKEIFDISSLLGGGGLFSSASLIMLHEIQDARPKVKTNLSELLSKIPPDTIVLVHYSISDYRRAKWLDSIKKISRVVSLNGPDSSVLPRIVNEIAAKHQLKMDEAAILRLIELSSGELAIIDNEIEKLALYKSDSSPSINRDLVDKVAGAVENAKVSQFIDAISIRDPKIAIQTLVEIHHQGKEGLPYLVVMLYTRLIQLMALRETPEARKTISQSATSYYFLKELHSVSKNYTLSELQQATSELAELDLQFRLGSVDILTSFTAWVSKVV